MLCCAKLDAAAQYATKCATKCAVQCCAKLNAAAQHAVAEPKLAAARQLREVESASGCWCWCRGIGVGWMPYGGEGGSCWSGGEGGDSTNCWWRRWGQGLGETAAAGRELALHHTHRHQKYKNTKIPNTNTKYKDLTR